ncbi:hypothetical protein ACLKA6_008350 [Drosophila palustris]
MDMQLLTVLLGICLSLRFSVGIGEDEDEAQLYSFNSQEQESNSMLDDCIGPEALRFKEPQLSSKRQLQKHSSNIDPGRTFKYGHRARICPAENTKVLPSNEDPKTKSKIPKEEDYDDDEEVSDEMESSNYDDEKDFTARVSCLLQTLYDNMRAMSADLEELDAGILSPETASKCKYSKHQRPKKLSNLMVKENYCSDVDSDEKTVNNVPDNEAYAQSEVEASPQISPRDQHNGAYAVSEVEASPQLSLQDQDKRAYALSEIEASPQLSLRDQASDRIPLVDLQLPFMVPSPSVLVPLLNRHSWSLAVPNFEERRRYLNALNELRLARAIQAAAAARHRHGQRSSEFQEHVEEFKENLRRLVSNRAVIERRVNGILDGLHNP